MFAKSLTCLKCNKRYDLGWFFEGCKGCESEDFTSNLTVDYDYERIKESLSSTTLERPHQLWGYKELLPVKHQSNFVTLGEGNTPLINSSRLGEKLGLINLYFKNEGMNPTLSYKDRLASVAVSKGLEFGVAKTVVSSSGNHGAAAAAYSARAGLECVIFTLSTAPPTMLAQMRCYSDKVIAVTSSEGRWDMMKKCVDELKMYPLSTYTRWPTGNPYGVEGYKTIAYEIFSQMSKNVPDFVVVPVGYGDGLYGIWKGFWELRELGFSSSIPRMVAVETSAGAPLNEAYRHKRSKIDRVPIKHDTVAFSIMTTVCGYHALCALRESSGLSYTMGDQEIFNSQSYLAQLEGLAAEASSAATVAAVNELAGSGELDKNSSVVCILTSSALKQLSVNPKWSATPTVVDPDWRKVRELLR
jgi:threonine synthase